MAQEAWRAYLELALGMTEASRKKAKKAVKQLVGMGPATADQLQAMAEDLVRIGFSNREALARMVRLELDRAIGTVGLALSEDVAGLDARIRKLEETLRTTAGPTTPVDVQPDVSVPAAAGGAVAEKAAVAPRSVAKKTVAKKAAAKTSAVQPRFAEPEAAKKTVAKKAVARKAVAKKAAAESVERP